MDLFAAASGITRHAAAIELITLGLILVEERTSRKTLGEIASARSLLKMQKLPVPMPVGVWPSGIVAEPNHIEDPAPKLTLGSAVTFGYQRPKPGERQKKPKGK